MISLPFGIVEAASGILGAYVLLGGGSWGYILLRSGWPNVRGLESDYRAGWGMVIGIGISVVVLGSAGMILYLRWAHANFEELVFIGLGTLIVSGLVALNLKRKLVPVKKVKVSVPKRIVSASIIAKKVVGRFPEGSYIAAPAVALTVPSEQAIHVDTYENLKAGAPSPIPKPRPGEKAESRLPAVVTPGDAAKAVVKAAQPKIVQAASQAVKQEVAKAAEKPMKAPEVKTEAADEKFSFEKKVQTLHSFDEPVRTKTWKGGEEEWAKLPEQASGLKEKRGIKSIFGTKAEQTPAAKEQGTGKPAHGTGIGGLLGGIFGRKKEPAHAEAEPTVGEAMAAVPKLAVEAKPPARGEPAKVRAKAPVLQVVKPPRKAQETAVAPVPKAIIKPAAAKPEQAGKQVPVATAQPKTSTPAQAEKEAGKGIFSTLSGIFAQKAKAQAKTPPQQAEAIAKWAESKRAMSSQKPDTTDGKIDAGMVEGLKKHLEEDKVSLLRKKLGALKREKDEDGKIAGIQIGRPLDIGALREKLSVEDREMLAEKERSESAEQILGALERKQAAKSGAVVSGDTMMREEQKSKAFIRETLKERITPEPSVSAAEARQHEAESALPKSAMLLKKLLSEENGA